MSTLVSRDLWWRKVYGELYGDKGFPGSARGPLGTVGCQLVGSHLQGAHKQITDRCGKILGLRQKACVRPCFLGRGPRPSQIGRVRSARGGPRFGNVEFNIRQTGVCPDRE